MRQAAVALCDRLIGRELARLEHATPGITAAARAAARSGDFHAVAGQRDREAPGHALAVSAEDVARLGAFVAELHHAMGAQRWR